MKIKNLWKATFAALFMAVFIGGCVDENVEIVGVCPVVESTNPVNAAISVPLDRTVTVTFNEAMNPATITPDVFTLANPNGGKISGALTYNAANNTMSFDPTSKLEPNTTYTGTVASSVKDLMGNALQTPYIWSFKTSVSPSVILTDPLNLATGVGPKKVISATFSEAMDPSTITTSSYTLMVGNTLISGAVNYSGTTATFTPASDLLSGTTYTATITTEAKNAAGIPLATTHVWSFNTTASLGPMTVNLKSVARFGIFAGVGVSNNAGFSEIRNLDVGITPGVRTSVTGFPPAIVVNGSIYASDDIAPPGVPAMLTQAKQDLTDAYLFAEGATSPAPATVAGDLGGITLAPGIYKTTSTLLIQSGDLTLNAQGDVNAVWIFQIASDFTTVGGAGGNVILSGGAQAKNVYWQTGSSATIGDGTSFKGNILALTSITMNSGATAVGRMLARNGAVVLTNTNIIERP